MRVARKLTIPSLLEGLARKPISVPVAPVATVTGPSDWGLVTLLPGSPSIGDTCKYVADKTNGILWHLVYDGEGALPWKAIGAEPLFAEVEANQTTASTVYTDLLTVGPSITVPLAGDYRVDIGAALFCSTTASVQMSYAVGASAPVDADSLLAFDVANVGPPGTRPKRKASIAAGTALIAKYKTSAGTASILNRWMRVTPVRVG